MAIVGGFGDSSDAGAAWIFARTGGVWSQEGNKLVGTGAVGNADQGISVSLSSDGNTAIVGGLNDNGLAGAAWIFTRTGGVWSQQGSKLVGTGAAGNASQGVSVSLSSDGNTAIVGGGADNFLAGAAWIFMSTGGVWSQQGNKLVGTGVAGEQHQGVSVSLSSDGNTAIVGGFGDFPVDAGAAWIFTRTGGAWSQQGNKLVGTGAVGIARQGSSVSLSSDGNTAIVGGPGDNSLAGAAWIFTQTGGVWSQQGTKLVGTGAAGKANQGECVSLSSDGSTAIVGGWMDNSDAGAAWIYTRGSSSVDELGGEVPQQFGLEENYPNPFNPSTTIRYELPKSSTVRLSVMNVLGQEVSVLVNERRDAGVHEVKFDGSNLASGVYIYRLWAGDFVATKRLLLLK
jgi:hypothetical protein